MVAWPPVGGGANAERDKMDEEEIKGMIASIESEVSDLQEKVYHIEQILTDLANALTRILRFKDTSLD